LPFASKILRTAAGFCALAPRPYTVSVGKATSSPSRSACTAASISTWLALTTRTMRAILPSPHPFPAARSDPVRRVSHSASAERGAHPALRRMPQLVAWPVVLVELEGDHLGRIVPSDRLQAHRGAVGAARDGGEERVEVRSRCVVHLQYASTGIQPIAGGRGAVREIRHVHADRGNAALGAHRPVGSLESRASPLDEPLDI